MKWVKTKDKKPRSNVDVHIVTNSGLRSVARYWHVTGQWLTQANNIPSDDGVMKWKYEDAKPLP